MGMKPNKHYAQGIMLFLALVVGILSYNATWLGDDLIYSYFWHQGIGTGSPWGTYSDIHQLDSILDIPPSQWVHYHITNGRFMIHCVVQFFCAFGGKLFFSICNALMYPALVIVLLKLADVDWRKNNGLVLFVSVALLLSLRTRFTPAFQINYVWAFTATLWILYFFLNGKQYNKLANVGIFIASFIVGWGQEGINVGLAFAMFLYLVLNYKKVSARQITIGVAFCIGTCFLVFAPSNFARAVSKTACSIGIVAICINRIQMILYLPITILLLALVIFFRKSKLKTLYASFSFGWNALFVLLIANLALGVIGNRQFFSIEILSLIILVKLYKEGNLKNPYMITRVGISFMLLATIFLGVKDIKALSIRKNAYNDIMAQYLSSKTGDVYYDFPEQLLTRDETAPGVEWDKFFFFQLKQHLFKQYNKWIQVNPTYLKGKENKHLKSCILTQSPGVFLIIHSNEDVPRKYIFNRGFNIFGKKISLNPYIFIGNSKGDYSIKDTYFSAYLYSDNKVIDYTFN